MEANAAPKQQCQIAKIVVYTKTQSIQNENINDIYSMLLNQNYLTIFRENQWCICRKMRKGTNNQGGFNQMSIMEQQLQLPKVAPREHPKNL